MTDETRMVDLPWVDGTTRTVPEWTAYKAINGYVYFARDGGYSSGPKWTYPHSDGESAAVRIFTEAPEPPVKVDLPTGLGAIVSLWAFSDYPGFVLTREGWRGLMTNQRFDPSEIADRLRNGARVLFEGVIEDAP